MTDNKMCAYCYRSYHLIGDLTELKKVQLRYYENGKIKWHKPILICPECRVYLTGVFRYCREE